MENARAPADDRLHVLVVEDEESVRRTLARNLERRGYRVSEARTVAWALTRCAADRPDLLVLDINLPDGSGWDVLRGLDAGSVARPAVVVVSAVSPTRQRLAEFAPLTFLPKPFLIEALLRAVERALEKEDADATVDRSAL